MRDIRRYWQEIRALEASLPEFVWLVSTNGSGLVQVAAQLAAKLLHAKSHRIASEQEIEAHRQAESAVKSDVRRDGLRRQGIALVPVSSK